MTEERTFVVYTDVLALFRSIAVMTVAFIILMLPPTQLFDSYYETYKEMLQARLLSFEVETDQDLAVVELAHYQLWQETVRQYQSLGVLGQRQVVPVPMLMPNPKAWFPQVQGWEQDRIMDEYYRIKQRFTRELAPSNRARRAIASASVFFYIKTLGTFRAF